MPLFNSLLPSFARRDEAPASPTLRPVYDVRESADAWNITVQLPGVTKENLSITDENGTLTVRGDRSWKQPEGWTSLYRESADLPYHLALQHDNEVDADKARAEIKDGVLQLTLPKAEARKPRKIAIA